MRNVQQRDSMRDPLRELRENSKIQMESKRHERFNEVLAIRGQRNDLPTWNKPRQPSDDLSLPHVPGGWLMVIHGP